MCWKIQPEIQAGRPISSTSLLPGVPKALEKCLGRWGKHSPCLDPPGTENLHLHWASQPGCLLMALLSSLSCFFKSTVCPVYLSELQNPDLFFSLCCQIMPFAAAASLPSSFSVRVPAHQGPPQLAPDRPSSLAPGATWLRSRGISAPPSHCIPFFFRLSPRLWALGPLCPGNSSCIVPPALKPLLLPRTVDSLWVSSSWIWVWNLSSDLGVGSSLPEPFLQGCVSSGILQWPSQSHRCQRHVVQVQPTFVASGRKGLPESLAIFHRSGPHAPLREARERSPLR